jgi:hypothetical protein
VPPSESGASGSDGDEESIDRELAAGPREGSDVASEAGGSDQESVSSAGEASDAAAEEELAARQEQAPDADADDDDAGSSSSVSTHAQPPDNALLEDVDVSRLACVLRDPTTNQLFCRCCRCCWWWWWWCPAFGRLRCMAGPRLAFSHSSGPSFGRWLVHVASNASFRSRTTTAATICLSSRATRGAA